MLRTFLSLTNWFVLVEITQIGSDSDREASYYVVRSQIEFGRELLAGQTIAGSGGWFVAPAINAMLLIKQRVRSNQRANCTRRASPDHSGLHATQTG
jgi:hypothetical protein